MDKPFASQPEWGPEEQFLANLLEQEPNVLTPDCLQPEETIGLIEQGIRFPGAARLYAHMAGCALCSREFADAWQAYQDFDAATASLASAPPATSGHGADGIASRWWKLLFAPSLGLAGAAVAFAAVYFTIVRTQKAQIATLQSKIETLAKGHAQDSRLLAETEKRLSQQSSQATQETQETQHLRLENEALQQQVRSNQMNIAGGALVQEFRRKGLEVLPPPGNPERETHYASGDTKREIQPLQSANTFVLEPRPEFAWQSVPGKQVRYQVVIARNNKVVAQSPLQSATHWTSSVELEPGALYLWQVRATETNGTQPVAISKSFSVERGDSSALQADLLSVALRYARLGHWGEARDAVQSVLKIAPDNRDARRLSRSLESLERNSSKIPR